MQTKVKMKAEVLDVQAAFAELQKAARNYLTAQFLSPGNNGGAPASAEYEAAYEQHMIDERHREVYGDELRRLVEDVITKRPEILHRVCDKLVDVVNGADA